MNYFDQRILFEGLFLGLLLILGFIGITQIGKRKKITERAKYLVNEIYYDSGTAEYQIYRMINVYRQENNLNVLFIDFKTHYLARRRCEEMIVKNVLEHKDAVDEFSELMVLGADDIGENIAYGYGTIEGLMNSWKKSETHNRNMLNPHWDWIGIGVVADKNDRNYYCTIFCNDNEL